MTKIAKKIHDRRELRDLQRAIDDASTPAMRNELIAIARRAGV